MPSDKVIKAMFGTPSDVSGKTQFQTEGTLFKKKKKKEGYTRIDEIMDIFSVSAADAQIWASGGYSDEDIREKLKKRGK